MEHGRLKAHIEAEEESLKDNFEEIQNRMKDALDWKVWYKNNTALALGGVAAGGLLLSLLIPRSPSNESAFHDEDEMDEIDVSGVEPNGRARIRSKSPSRLHQVLDSTMEAVLGVASDKLQDYMSKAIPGFREHYTQAQRRRFE